MTLTTTESSPLPPPTILSIPAASLPTSEYLPQIFNVTNRAYGAGRLRRHIFPPSATSRLQTASQLCEEIGLHGFTIIMLRRSSDGDEEEVIATASAKPFVPFTVRAEDAGEDNKISNLFKRRPTVGEPLLAEATKLRWEILAMAVDPPFQGQGLASQLLGLVIDEVKARTMSGLGDATEADARDVHKGEESEGHAHKQLTLMLSTMHGHNEKFYIKRGWRTTDVKRFEPGTMGSTAEFGIAEMVKIVDL